MRDLVLLMAAVLAVGYCFSGREPAPDHAGPILGWHEELRQPRPAVPGQPPHQGPDATR